MSEWMNERMHECMFELDSVQLESVELDSVEVESVELDFDYSTWGAEVFISGKFSPRDVQGIEFN